MIKYTSMLLDYRCKKFYSANHWKNMKS